MHLHASIYFYNLVKFLPIATIFFISLFPGLCTTCLVSVSLSHQEFHSVSVSTEEKFNARKLKLKRRQKYTAMTN